MDLDAHFNATTRSFQPPPYAMAWPWPLLAVSLFGSNPESSPAWKLGMRSTRQGFWTGDRESDSRSSGSRFVLGSRGGRPSTNITRRSSGLARLGGPGPRFEMILRKTYTGRSRIPAWRALTLLAANVPLLDLPLQAAPVLAEHYWLTIHVPTEVSSTNAASFDLADGAGLMIAKPTTLRDHTAAPSYVISACPVCPGLPRSSVGAFGLAASHGSFNLNLTARADLPVLLSSALAAWSARLSIIAFAGSSAMPRAGPVREEAVLDAARDRLGDDGPRPPAATSVQTVAGRTCELRGRDLDQADGLRDSAPRAAHDPPSSDARWLAMQARLQDQAAGELHLPHDAGGVLFDAAGHILGGVWAD